jgi:hypothetical protein
MTFEWGWGRGRAGDARPRGEERGRKLWAHTEHDVVWAAVGCDREEQQARRLSCWGLCLIAS